jgi:uncharacterized membrane protein YfhO
MKTSVKLNKFTYPVGFLLPLLMIWTFYALCGVWPFGDSTILTGDLGLEFVSFYKYFLSTFTTKNDLTYMLCKTIGGEAPGLASYYLHDPLLPILFLFPGEKITVGIEVFFSIQAALAGLSMSFLLNRRYEKRITSVIFSTAYSLCGFFIGYLVLTIYMTTLAFLPIVLYLFLNYLDGDGRKGRLLAILSIALYIYLHYYLGFMLIIFLGLLFLTRLIEKPDLFRRIPDTALTVLTALLIDGLHLLRTALALKGMKTTSTADYSWHKNFPMSEVFAQFYSGSTRNVVMPLIYCSIPVIFMALYYFLSGKYHIRQKLANALLLATLFISMQINTLDSVWHGFNNPEGFLWRYSYYVSIIMIVLGYKGWLALIQTQAADTSDTQAVTDTRAESPVDAVSADRSTPSGLLLPLAKCIAIGALLFGYLTWQARKGNPYLDPPRQIVNTLLIIAVTAAMILVILRHMSVTHEVIKKWLPTAGIILLALITMSDLLYDARTIYMRLNGDDDVLPSISEYEAEYRHIDDAIREVQAMDDGFYRIEKDFDMAVNDTAKFDYMGLSHNSSCEQDAVIDWLRNFGFCKTVYYTYYNGGSTSFADCIFGVKYLLSDKGDCSRFADKPSLYTRLENSSDFRLYQNKYTLPIAFGAPSALKDLTFGDNNTFEKQNEVASCWPGTSEKDIYRRASSSKYLEGAQEQEAGHFVKTDEEGYIVYDIKVTDDLPLYMYFSAPARQSAEVFVNDESYDWYFTENHWNVLNIGTYEKGDTVEVKMQILNDDLWITEACFYYEDPEALSKWGQSAALFTEGIGEIDEVSSSHFRINADLTDNRTVVLSIPYDSAWHIKCDGRRVKGVPVMEMLLGMDIPSGSHTIEMKYVPHGTVPGIFISLAGIILLVLLCHSKFASIISGMKSRLSRKNRAISSASS